MDWLQTLSTEFAITVATGSVWLAIAQGLVFGGVCLALGIWAARLVGLLGTDAPAGETLGVGLASGLLVVATLWAAIMSSGRSSFTPSAIGFAVALVLALARRRNSPQDAEPTRSPSAVVANDVPATSTPRRRDLVVAVLGGALFVVAIALLFGSTMAPSPREGLQPLEFNDTAYYAVLGADLAKTGTESITSPSGFASIPGLPQQAWYHWGELWLAAAVIRVFGADPIAARHFMVLPLLLLAAASLTGTLVRRMNGTQTQGAFVFGFLACLFLAPIPLIAGPFFSSFARGLIYGITTYGLAAVAALLSIYSFAVLASRTATWPLAAFVASSTAVIVPAHIVIALLAVVGIGSVWAIRIVEAVLRTRHLPILDPLWLRTFAVTGFAVVVTLGWGLLTGHGVGNSGLFAGVSSFNAAWRESVAITIVGAGVLFAIPIAWFLARGDTAARRGLYVGAIALFMAGALVWGARLADFNAYHTFFAAIVVFVTPVAAVAVWSIWLQLRTTGHRALGVTILAICLVQITAGVGLGVLRLVSSGAGSNTPAPVSILEAIKTLPSDARLAYACRPSEEVVFWNAQLLGIDAHTGRRIMPLCFQAETAGEMIGGQMSPKVPGPLFPLAPQSELYPDADARPSSESILSFLKRNGIGYIYADTLHPNTLVPDATAIATSGETSLLRVP